MARSRMTKRQRDTLKNLEKLAVSLGIRVSFGDLRFGGLKLKPGQCLFHDEKWVVMDRRLPFEEQVEVFRQAFMQMDIKTDSISPELQRVLAIDPSGRSSKAADK